MPTLTLRPTSATGDWIVAGSGSLSDDSDASYLYFTNPYQYGTAQFATAGIPWGAGVIVRTMVIRGRIRCVGGPFYLQLIISTAKFGKAIVSGSDGMYLYTADFVFAVKSSAAIVAALQQSDGDVVVSVHPTVAGGSEVDVSEMYLDVVYIWPPTVTVIQLPFPGTTYTTLSNPPYRYLYNSLDQLPQAARRILVYSAAQYGAAGFAPGVSTPTYDSGVEYTSSFAGTLPALVNGTYRMYVNVAQLVNGAYQWGTVWNLTDFIIAITPPAAPTITPTADSTNAKIKLAVVGSGAANSILNVYDIQRSFDGGVTWSQVRGDYGAYVQTGGARIWYDYETGNGQAAVYRARTITYDTVGNQLIGAYSATSSSASWTSTSTWMKLVTHPELNRTVIVRVFGAEDYNVPGGTFQGLDSDEVVSITGVRRSRPDASITILSQTEAEEAAIRAILAIGEPLLIHASSKSTDWRQVSKYLSVMDVRVTRPTRIATSPLRDLSLPYSEIARPDVTAFPVSYGLNTWQDIDDLYATFTALNAAYATYGEIRG
jgi:hypothetical protein